MTAPFAKIGYCKQSMTQIQHSPYRHIKRSTQKLAGITRKGYTGDAFGMSLFKATQTLPCLNFPYLKGERFTIMCHYCMSSSKEKNTHTQKWAELKSTFNFPSCPPDANISLSRLNAKQRTESSIIMKLSWAWYFKSFLIFPVVKLYTSMKPSTLPVTKYWPSGENLTHSGCDLVPN